MIDKNTVPEHWEVKKLGEVCLKVEKVKRKEKNLKEELKYLDIGGINNKTNRITDYKTYNWETAPSRAQQIIYQGDILFSTVRTYLKNIAYVDKEIYNGQIASSGFCVIRANVEVVKSNFLFYLSLSHDFLQPLNELQTGSSYPAVRDKDVFSQLIPVPPLSEQQEIVAKIEELFSELDKGKEQLEAARQQLKVYRQAVLKWAFEGKLSRNHRLENGLNDSTDFNSSHAKEISEIPKSEKIRDSDNLPEGWKWVNISEIVKKNKYALKAGPFGSALKKEFYIEKGYKVYGQEQVISGNPFLGDYYISGDKYNELKSCQIKPYDILISLVGTVGKVLILPLNCQEGIINPRLIKVSLNRDIYLPLFFKYYFERSTVKSFYSSKAQGTTMDVLNLGIIKTIPFPYCSINEQAKVVQEIESRLSVCDKVEETIAQCLQQAETLRQSILKKAFEGKLVKPSIPAPEVSYVEPFTINQ